MPKSVFNNLFRGCCRGGAARVSDVGITQELTFELGWWVCYFCLYLLVYFPLFQRNGLHWDELLDAGGAANGTYIAAGRWGLALYRRLFEVGYMPWASGIVAGVYIATALVIQYKLLGIISKGKKLLYGVFYVGCIQWATQLQYSHQSDAVALALLCMTSAVYLFTLKCWRSDVLAACLIVYACSVYQTAMLYFLVVWMLHIMATPVSFISEWRRLAKVLVCVFIAGCLYLLSSAISKNLPVVSEEDLFYMKTVQSSMSKWSEIAAALSWSDKIDLWQVYIVCYTKVLVKNLLGLTYEGQWVYATSLWPVLGLLWRYLREKRDVVRAVLLLLVWMMPFVMTLVVLTDQGARVSLAEPLSVAGIWALYLRDGKKTGCWRWCVVILGGLVLLKSVYRCAVIAEDEKNIYISKMENLRSLNNRILTVAESANMASPVVIYFGSLPTETWNPYVKRWGCYRESESLMLLPNGRFPGSFDVPLRKCSAEEISNYEDVVKDMPIWPAPGSVTKSGNAVLVRFAD